MYNPGNLKNNGANQDDVQKRNNENFVGRNMSLISNNAKSPQSESASKTSTTAALRRWRRPEAQDSSSKNVSTRSSSSDTENGVKLPSTTVNQSKEMNPLNNNTNSYANNTHIDHLNGSASQNGYPMFVSPASLSPIVPQSTARPYDTNAAYIPRVPPETGAYSRTSPVVSTPNKLMPEVKSSDTTVRHPISGSIQSPYYPHDNAAQQHYRNNVTGYPIQNTPPLTPTSTQSPIYGVPHQKRDYGYQSYTAKSPQEQRITREHSVLTHSYSVGSGMNLDSSRVPGIGDDSKMNGYRQDSRVISQGYHLQNTAERRVTPPKPKSPTYRNFPNSSAMMDSRILAQNYVTSSGRVQAAELMAQNYFLNKSSCIVQEARVQNQIHSTENPILDSRYQQSYNSYIMPKTTVINSQDPKLFRNIITNNKKHAAPFPILEQRLNTAESYSPEYLPQNNPQTKYAQVLLPRSSPTSRITRESSNIPMHSNYIPQPSNQKCPQEMMIPSNYALHNKYFQQNQNQDWRLIKDYEPNTHLNQMNQMHSRLPNASTNRIPEVPRDIPYLDQNQRITQKPRMFYPEPGSVDYLQYAGKTNIPVTQKSSKVISYNVSDQRISDQIQNDYLNLTRTSSNAVRQNEFSRNPVIQAPNLSEGSYIVHQAYRSDVPNDQHNYQMVQNSRHPSYAINYSNRQVKEIPPRNISPRRTFQENMPYFVISPPHAGLSNTSPPIYNSEHPQHNYPGYYSRDPNYPGGVGAKPTIPQYPVDSAKYQNMAFSRNMISQQRHPYGYQEQYIQRNMDPNQFPGNMYRQHNHQAISDQAVQARSYAEEYRNEDSMNSSFNEFERNRRKEEIGKSLKEFLESWEDDEDIVSNLPDLVLNIPTDRQKNNSVSSLESGENNEAGKTVPNTNEIHKDNQGNPQAEPLYVLDARSISSDALSQYLPYCKVYQSLPENIRGFYPNSVPSEDASVQSQQVASEASETQPESEDLETNIIDSPSPHDLSVNRKTGKEDNIQAEVLNLSTNRNKENDEFMTEEYSNASDDISVPENVSSPSMSDTIYTKEVLNKQGEVIKSPEAVQNKNKIDINTNDKSIQKEEISKDIKIATSVENDDKRESLEAPIEKPITASVIVQNTFLSNKSDNSNEKPQENQSERTNTEKSSKESNNKIPKNDVLNEDSENISASENKNFKKRPSVDSLESADSIRTSLIESEIKDIDFTKDNLDDDQFDFDTALLSTETKDSNEDVPQDTKTDEDGNKNSPLRNNGIDISLETMLLSPEPIDTSFEDCIPEVAVASSPKTDDICTSITKNKEKEEVFDEPSVENVAVDIKLTNNNKITTDSVEMSEVTSTFLETANTEATNECNSIEKLNNSEKNDESSLDTTEHTDNLEINKLDTELHFNKEPDSPKSETNHEAKNNSPLESTDVNISKESENVTEDQLISSEDNFEKIDNYKIEISEKEMDLSTMDDENSVCEPQFSSKSSFSIVEILKQVDNSKKDQEENNEAVNIDEEIIESDDSKLSETIEQADEISPINEEDINNEAESYSDKSSENNYLENVDDTTDITSDNDELSEAYDKKSDPSFISEDNSMNSVEIKNDDNFQRSLDVDLSESRTSIPPELKENNETSDKKIETSVDNDSIKCTDPNEDIEVVTSENNGSKNDNSITVKEIVKDVVIKNVQELSGIETKSFEDSVELLSETTKNVEKINTPDADINHKNTNEIFKNDERIEVINEEKLSSQDEPSQKNISDHNLIINSPSVSIQEEITLDEEITDKNITDETKENQITDIEIVAENKSNINSTCVKNEEAIITNQENHIDQTSIIKEELSLFDEDTITGFEDFNQGVDKEIEMTGEVKTVETEMTIEELNMENKLDTSDLPSEQSNDCMDTSPNDTIQTVTDHVSSDADEYQHLITLEDEETLGYVDEETDNTSTNKEKDTAPIDEETDNTSTNKEKDTAPIDEETDNTSTNKKKDTSPIDKEKDKTSVDPIKIDSKETSIEVNPNTVIIQSSSNVLPYEEEKDIFVESPKNILDEEVLINLRPENKSTPKEVTTSEEVLKNKEIEAANLIEDDITTKVNVLLNEELLVELTNENMTFIENIPDEITQEVEENILVSDNSSCVVVYSDNENIVILQSNPNELENPENEDATYITTEETNSEEAVIKENTVVLNMEKEDFIPEKIIEEEIIGNEVIICENGIEDDWIQNEEIVETKIEVQSKKEEKSKVVSVEKKRLLMEKRREKKRRLEKLRKRKLLSTIKTTNQFLEEERNAYFITETLIIENSNSNSPFKEKITEDKELFINPENPSSSSEDKSSMTHELLNLKPRVKRSYSFVDSSSPKIDFVAPKRRYSNMEYIRNNFKKPIINLDEVSSNITKVIENLNKQENLQYHHSFENSKPTLKPNDKIQEIENEKHLGRFKIRKIINTDDFFVKPAETPVKPFIKPIINFNNEKADDIILCKEKNVQESQIESNTIPNEIITPKNVDETNKSGCSNLNKPKNEDISSKIEETSNEEIKIDKFKSERNSLQSIKQSLKEVKTNIKIDTISDSNYENLPSFQNYTDDLRKKIKADVTNKDDANSTLLLQMPSVVIHPLTVSKISPRLKSETENRIITTPLTNALILPNKQRNNDPRIDRPKETPKPEDSSVLVKNKTSKTFGLTEYTKHYLKMKTGQTIDPQMHFAQNGIKRLDPRLTIKPEKATENIKTEVLPKESATHNNDNLKSKNSQEKKVKINLQDYRNRKLSLSESEKQPTNPKEQLDDSQENSSVKSDSTNGLSKTEPCRFYIRDKSKKLTNLLDNKTVEKIVIKPKKILDKASDVTIGASKDNTNKQSVTTIYSTNNHNLDCNNLSNDNINKTLKSNLDFKIQKPKKRRKRFRNLDASDEDDEVVSKQQNVTAEHQNGIVEEVSLKSNEDSQNSSTIFKHSVGGDSNCSCCVDLNSNGGTTINNCGFKCHIKLNSLDSKIRNYEINKNSSGISNLKLTLKPVKKKSKPAFAEVLSSIDSVVGNEVTATKRKPSKPGLNKCDSGKKATMWTIKNKVPKVIIKRNASGYCAVFRDVSSNPIWQPKIRLKRQKYIESLVLSNQVKMSKKIPS